MARSILIPPSANRKLSTQNSERRPIKSYRKLAAMLLADFENWMRSRSYSEHTIRSYLHVVRSYLNSLRSANPVDRPETSVRGYLDILMARRSSRPTIAHHLSVLREFFKHLERDGIVKRWGSPLLEIPRQHGYYRKLPRFLTEQEMMRLLDSTTDLRDRAMLEFLYASGCRIGELAALRVEDLDFEQCQTVVFGKGKKERVVFFGSKTVEALRAYLNGRTAGPLFPQKRYPDRPMTTRSLARFVSQATVRAGLGHWNPHAFRHSFATHLMNRGVNLVYVQKLLGHENLSTTAVYTHVALADLKKTHEQCHPRG